MKLSFSLTRSPVNEQEQAVFREDLDQLGLDDTVWLILNGAVATATKYSIPKVLRAYHGDEPVGVAYIIECRRTGQCFFDNEMLAALCDAPALPIFFWDQTCVISDSISNPGFVTGGLTRERFVTEAIGYLQRKYLSGSTCGRADTPAGQPCLATPFPDYGIVDLRSAGTPDGLFDDSKNLRKKTHKFHNKGGSIDIICGSLQPSFLPRAEQCLNSVRIAFRTPFQDGYTAIAMHACTHESDRLVHFIARLNGEVVGYHSFAISGRNMYCLSGAFDRTRHSTFHAYENVILESIHFCREHDIDRIYYGPVLNPTKAKMMNEFQRCELRFYSRFPPVRAILPTIIRRSKIGHQSVADYVGLGASREKTGPASLDQ